MKYSAFILKDRTTFLFYHKSEDMYLIPDMFLCILKTLFSLTHNMHTDTGNSIVSDRKCWDWSLKWQYVLGKGATNDSMSDCILKKKICLAWNKQMFSYFWVWTFGFFFKKLQHLKTVRRKTYVIWFNPTEVSKGNTLTLQ